MRVSHITGSRRTRSRYSIKVPTRISMGAGVVMRKRSEGGVMASRFAALEKKAKTSSRPAARRCSR
jgi:hypothetical protein